MRRAALLAVTAAAIAGCGQRDEGALPRDRADRLAATLREVARATADGDCTLARQFLGRAERRVADLPADVDERIVARLQEGLERLRTQVPRECLPEQDPEIQPPATTPQETAPPATTMPEEEEEPPPQTTATTEPPPETQVPTTPAEPPPGEEQPGAGGSGGAGAEGEPE